MCQHQPACPSADASDREAAAVLVAHPEQGWSLLCNGVISFEDTGLITPDGRAIGPCRAAGWGAPIYLPRRCADRAAA
jgi:hypothetical protein